MLGQRPAIKSAQVSLTQTQGLNVLSNEGMLGVELISTLLGKVLLGYEHNYIFVRSQKVQGSHTQRRSKIARRLAARETDEGEENPIFNAFNSPSLSTPKFARVDPLNPWTRIQLVPTWKYGSVTTWGQHLCML